MGVQLDGKWPIHIVYHKDSGARQQSRLYSACNRTKCPISRNSPYKVIAIEIHNDHQNSCERHSHNQITGSCQSVQWLS